jgi:excisionase family DNA binding protein
MPRQKQPKEEVMSLFQLQKYLRLGYYKTLGLLTTGQIPAQKIGTRWRIHRDSAIAWLNSGGKESSQ